VSAARRQRTYDEAYAARVERDRPKAPLEMHEIRRLAERAARDPSAALDYTARVTPEVLMLALQAQAWDERHPYYACIACRDGKDIPRGYVCRDCGEENPD
jgi:hypothetical protein